MSRTTITLPTKLDAIARARAAERGCGSVQQYVQMLVQADAPTRVDPELERELLKSLASPAREVTAQFWSAKKRQLKQRVRKAKPA